MLVYLKEGGGGGAGYWLVACLTSQQHASVSEGRTGVRFVGCLLACLLNVQAT